MITIAHELNYIKHNCINYEKKRITISKKKIEKSIDVALIINVSVN